jgi:hypothetical protein
MATTTSDKRIVRVTVTEAEMSALIGQKAKDAGLIDFDPDRIEVFHQGQGAGYEVTFELTTPVTP